MMDFEKMAREVATAIRVRPSEEDVNAVCAALRDYEAGRRVPGPNNLAAMQWVMEAHGVRFIADGAEIGATVRKNHA